MIRLETLSREVTSQRPNSSANEVILVFKFPNAKCTAQLDVKLTLKDTAFLKTALYPKLQEHRALAIREQTRLSQKDCGCLLKIQSRKTAIDFHENSSQFASRRFSQSDHRILQFLQIQTTTNKSKQKQDRRSEENKELRTPKINKEWGKLTGLE